jgi:hypothetical protein
MFFQLIRTPQFKIICIFLFSLISQIIYENTNILFFYYSFFVFIIGGTLAGLYLTWRAFYNQYKEWKETNKKAKK